jgi:hypothetical protein
VYSEESVTYGADALLAKIMSSIYKGQQGRHPSPNEKWVLRALCREGSWSSSLSPL